ncbi:hypothetical protein [Aeromonas dhakensis]|uniref:hypothetical protein n=1 Tax=Aeromonas dhakensis TaxID=196024 RepID=UPI0005AA8CE5|nr:hypothetical protein [Aeromonas dhakensis]
MTSATMLRRAHKQLRNTLGKRREAAKALPPVAAAFTHHPVYRASMASAIAWARSQRVSLGEAFGGLEQRLIEELCVPWTELIAHYHATGDLLLADHFTQLKALHWPQCVSAADWMIQEWKTRQGIEPQRLNVTRYAK